MVIKSILNKIGYLVGRKNSQGFPVRYDEWGKETLPAFRNYDWTDVIDPVTRDQVIQWVKDLESGKFTQTRDYLKVKVDGEACHCCLGVFADTNGKLGKDGNPEEDGYELYVFTGSGSICTLGADQEWNDDLNDYEYGPGHVFPQELQKKYYTMNDSQGKSFTEIAQEIRKDFGID